MEPNEKPNTSDAPAPKKTNTSMRQLVCYACSLAVFFFLFLAVVCTNLYSFGWFATNSTLGGNGMTVSVEESKLDCSFSLYAYDLNQQKATNSKTVESGGVETTVPYTLTNFEFNTHDAIFEVLNQYTPALLQIDISGGYIEGNQSGSIRIYLTRNAGTSSSSKLTQTTSNVIGFAADFSSAIDAETTADGKWQKAKDLYEAGTAFQGAKMFISQSGSTYTVQESIYLDVNYTSADRRDVGGVPTLTLYVYMDYNETYTGKMILQLNTTSSSFSTDRLVPLSNDLASIRLVPNT